MNSINATTARKYPGSMPLKRRLHQRSNKNLLTDSSDSETEDLCNLVEFNDKMDHSSTVEYLDSSIAVHIIKRGTFAECQAHKKFLQMNNSHADNAVAEELVQLPKRSKLIDHKPAIIPKQESVVFDVDFELSSKLSNTQLSQDDTLSSLDSKENFARSDSLHNVSPLHQSLLEEKNTKDSSHFESETRMDISESVSEFNKSKLNEIEFPSDNEETSDRAMPQKTRYVLLKEYNNLIKRIKGIQAALDLAEVNRGVESFEFNEIDIVKDISGRNPVKWALKVVDHLFTRKELSENTIEQSSRTTRGALDPVRVTFLKRALRYKYKFDDEKFDKTWLSIKKAVDTKGRNIKAMINLRTAAYAAIGMAKNIKI